jgi:hypothetical protein
MSAATALALGAALQIFVDAVVARFWPEVHREHPPTVMFSSAQLVAIAAWAIVGSW